MFCYKCGLEMGESAFCVNCGSPRVVAPDPQEPAASETVTAKLSIADRWKSFSTPVKGLIAAGAAAALVIAMAAFGVFENGDIAQCKRLVKESLKAPSSARFFEATVTYGTDGQTGERSISVKGIVEAQNGFGVQVRGEYWCTNYNTDELEVEYVSAN